MTRLLPQIGICLALASSSTSMPRSASDQLLSPVTSAEMRKFEHELESLRWNDWSATAARSLMEPAAPVPVTADEWIGDTLNALLSDVPDAEWQKLPRDFSSHIDDFLYG